MRTAVENIVQSQFVVGTLPEHKLRAIVVDGTPAGIEVVSTLLDFHEVVDVVGRAANIDEAFELAINLRPDLILVDIEMPSANLLVTALILCNTFAGIRIIGLCEEKSIPVKAPGLILDVDAFIHKANFREEFQRVMDALYGGYFMSASSPQDAAELGDRPEAA
jgi:DNA-binding NarL/FixJ family response regulator